MVEGPSEKVKSERGAEGTKFAFVNRMISSLVGLFAFFILAFGFIALVVLGIALSFKQKKPQSITATSEKWEPPKADRLPYKMRRYIFSASERSFYEVLRRLVPSHTVFAKVRLADLVSVESGVASWQTHFNRIQSKHIDFVVLDSTLSPVVAVELDDSTHDREERKMRDEFVNEVLSVARLPIVRVRAKRTYVPAELLALLSPYTGKSSKGAQPPAIQNDESRYMPPDSRMLVSAVAC